jgi:hypothetical protein
MIAACTTARPFSRQQGWWRRWLVSVSAALFTLVAACGQVLAAGGGKAATKLVNVADTRALPPGYSRWVADIYNTNLWLFGLLVVVVMVLMGLVLGLAFDKAIGLLGINLGKLDHHE